MWTKSHTVITQEVTKEQLWKLFADVNNWHTWDAGIDMAKLNGRFEKGNQFLLKPKGGPTFKVAITEAIENRKFSDATKLLLATMHISHEFIEVPDGLQITSTVAVEGLLSFFWIKMIASKIAAHFPEEVQQHIKAAKKYG